MPIYMPDNNPGSHAGLPAPAVKQHHSSIAKAYAAAGLTYPNVHMALAEKIHALPTVDQVAAQVAREAYTPAAVKDPEKFLKAAIANIREAQAATALKEAYRRAETQAGIVALSTAIDQARDDLDEKVSTDIDMLIEEAAHLDRDTPLDVEKALARDAGQSLTRVRNALLGLARWASIHGIPTDDRVPRELRRLLPVIDLPETVVEVCERGTLSTEAKVVNRADLAPTYLVRNTLGPDAKKDIDTVLVKVAQGQYPGVTLSLATVDGLRERHARARRAWERTFVDNADAQPRGSVAAGTR
ncbi:hypothetical protein [Brevibacterium litoralis]|uniref:hypothetical protein n=1 Tax=Brevibacterium litoralis TaxID=3138935 RepID=UPI0032EEADFB